MLNCNCYLETKLKNWSTIIKKHHKLSNMKKEKQKIRVFTAFSGYDSQMMAMQRLEEMFPDLIESELVGWSEIDEPAIASHNAVFPEAKDLNKGDISKVKWDEVPDFDLFTYSSPCQDFSVSGRQRGGEAGSGTRSSLLWECERTIREKRPKYCLLENVKALYADKKFYPLLLRWRDTVNSYGYKSWIQVLNAKDYDVPQGRERVFMVSIRNDVLEQDFDGMDYHFPAAMTPKRKITDFLVPQEMVPEEYYLSAHKVPKFLNLLNHAGDEYEDTLDEDQRDAIASKDRTPSAGEDNDIRWASYENGLKGYVPLKNKDNALI